MHSIKCPTHHVYTSPRSLSVNTGGEIRVFKRVRKIAKSDCQLRHVCPSVYPHAKNSVATRRIVIKFDIWVFFFQNLSRKFNFIKIGQEKGLLYMKTDIHFWSYLAHFFLEWKMFQTNVVEKLEIHILCSVTAFRISCCSWDHVEKYCRSVQAIDDNMDLAHCMLDT